jgi:putative protease
MPYELVVDGKARPLGDVQYLLSPKDLAGVAAIPELLELGVHGLKIEGRQKSPQYVATATGGYRRWVDALAAGGDRKQAERQLANDLLAMSLSYTRGFSDGFLGGSDHQTLVEGRFPKHRGVFVGRVVRVHGNAVVVTDDPEGRPWTGASGMLVRPDAPAGERSAPLPGVAAAPLQLRAGMGVVFDQGDPEDKNEPGGPLFGVERSGRELRLLFGQPGPDLARVRAGDRVFATNDPALASATARELRDDAPEPEGRIAVELVVQGAVGHSLVVRAMAGGHAAEVRSQAPLQSARGAGLDAAILRDKLAAFGGTPFRLGELDVTGLAPGLHVPASELKELRRALVAALLPPIERGPVRTVDPAPAIPRVAASLAAVVAGPAVAPHVVPLVRTDAQLDAAIAAGCREVELDWMEFVGLGKAFERARQKGLAVTVATTRIGKPGEDALVERIVKLQPDGVLVRHFGAMMRCLQARARGATFALHGDFSLNATNSLTARHLLAQGLATVTASFDLDEEQLFAMLAHVPGDRIAVVAQHRIPTFHTEHCVYSHLLSNGRDFRSCGRPCERHQVALRDHTGREHPVIVDVGCRNTVFHHQGQQSAQWTARLLGAGVRRFRVEFVRETGAQVATVVGAWRELLAGRIDAAELATRTGTHGQIGVAEGGMKLLAE